VAEDHHWDDVMPALTGERPLAPAPPRAAPRAEAAAPPPVRTRLSDADGGHRRLLGLAGAGLLVLLAVVAAAILRSSSSPAATAVQAVPGVLASTPVGPADPAAGAVEASALEGAGAELPALAVGEPPASPLPALGLRPTVVCRLLIDARGQVVRAEPFQRRADLEPFEAAALRAVATYRFAPARQDGAPVASWINWPVQFR
jgi:hypothetical protein